MVGILFVLLCLVLLAMVLKAFYKPKDSDSACDQNNGSSSCSSCTSGSGKCEQECMMEAATQPIEYFDDEELDRFKDRPSDSYTEDEVCEFAEVLNTMRQDEVKDWCRSLTLRQINLPDQLKDEAFILMER